VPKLWRKRNKSSDHQSLQRYRDHHWKLSLLRRWNSLWKMR